MEYKKKKITFKAIRWTGKNLQEVDDFMKGSTHGFIENDEAMYIQTLKGKKIVEKTDYIIEGHKGDFYSKSSADFDALYQDAEKVSVKKNGAIIVSYFYTYL